MTAKANEIRITEVIRFVAGKPTVETVIDVRATVKVK